LLVGRQRVVQEEIGDLVVDLGELLDELCALLGRQLKGRGWDLVGFNDIDAVRVASRLKFGIGQKKRAGLPFDTLVVDGLPTDKVNDTFQLILSANGNLNCGGWHAQLRSNLIDYTPWVRARSSSKDVRARGCQITPPAYLSILLMKDNRGTLYRCICRSTVIV
jgi:hypothetical protein